MNLTDQEKFALQLVATLAIEEQPEGMGPNTLEALRSAYDKLREPLVNTKRCISCGRACGPDALIMHETTCEKPWHVVGPGSEADLAALAGHHVAQRERALEADRLALREAIEATHAELGIVPPEPRPRLERELEAAGATVLMVNGALTLEGLVVACLSVRLDVNPHRRVGTRRGVWLRELGYQDGGAFDTYDLPTEAELAELRAVDGPLYVLRITDSQREHTIYSATLAGALKAATQLRAAR